MSQSPNRNQFFLIALVLLIAIALVLITWLNPRPFIIWNASESVPIGWYLVEHRKPEIHEIAVVKLDGWSQLYAAQRGYLPSNVWLLKPVAAVYPALVCRFGNYVLIDGKLVAKAKNVDRQHRILPRWKGCLALKHDELFVIARSRVSFDSPYFGPIKLSQVADVARRLHFPFE